MKLNLNTPTWLLIFSILIVSNSFKASSQVYYQGPFNPDSSTEEFWGCLACPGTNWLNPINVMYPDGQNTETILWNYPFCFQGSCYFSRGLMCNDYDFNIPSNALITGIQVEILRKASILQYVSDSIVQLMLDQSRVAINRASQAAWDTSSYYIPYGGPADLWDSTWTPAMINSSSFGIYVRTRNKNPAPVNDTAFIDNIRLTVFYELPNGISDLEKSWNPFIVNYNAAEKSFALRSTETIFDQVEIVIYDATGKSCLSKSVLPGQPGMLEEKISTINLLPGLYITSIKYRNKQYTSKFSVLN